MMRLYKITVTSLAVMALSGWANVTEVSTPVLMAEQPQSYVERERCLSADAPLSAEADMLIVAHRGASRRAPGNTLPAFELAWKQGADAIEGDFQLTKDGHVVCIHDKTTQRTAGTDLNVAQSSLSELRKLDVGAWFDPAFKGTRIPTLAEVLATVPVDGKIFIEIKSGAEIIPALLSEIKRSGLEDDQIMIICFKQEVLRELKAMAPQYQTSWLVSFKKKNLGGITPDYDSVLDTLDRIKADGLSSGRHCVDATLIQRVRENGLQHHVWTINDIQQAKQFKEWGTSSVTTDVPDAMKGVDCPI
jgi:glycerophosphoryl diester phosphodiesterase